MNRSLMIHALVALCTTVAAVLAWQLPHASTTETLVTVVPGANDKLRQIIWHDPQYDVTVKRDKDARDVQVIVRKAPPAGKEASVSPAAQAYPGSAATTTLFTKMLPLQSPRLFGKLKSAEVKPMGLESPTTRLELTVGSEAQVIDVGDAAYGTGDFYARTASGEVFVLPAAEVRELRFGANALQDRALVGFERNAVAHLAVHAGMQTRDLLQRQSDDGKKTLLSDPAEPDVALDQASAWVDRLLKLRAMDLADTLPTSEPVLTVELWDKQNNMVVVKFWPATGANAVAASTRFATPVVLAKAAVDAVLHDVDEIFKEGK